MGKKKLKLAGPTKNNCHRCGKVIKSGEYYCPPCRKFFIKTGLSGVEIRLSYKMQNKDGRRIITEIGRK